MSNKRKRYSPEFKAKVALAALKNEETTTGNSGDTLLIYHHWLWLFELEWSIQQPFRPFNESIIAYWPTCSLVFSDKCHLASQLNSIGFVNN